jgi:HEPN domain-containing protein
MEQSETDGISGSGRKRKKVRIRYKERIKLKERPRGHHLRRFLRKNGRNLLLLLLLLLSLMGAIYGVMVVDAKKEKARKEYRERMHQETLRKKNL